MPLNRIRIPSPNYSSRGGTAVTTLVLHTAEGARTFQALGSFFSQPSSQVSSHVGIDDTAGVIGEYVPRDGKAWHVASCNPWTAGAELCAFAAWTPQDWASHPVMLQNCAQWLREEAMASGIPLRLLSPQEAQNPAVKGICGHVDLGVAGGGHHDPGGGFPWARILHMAGSTSTPSGPPPAPAPAPGPGVPVLHVDYFGRNHNPRCGDVYTWQAQMSRRGWHIQVDGDYGPASEQVCIQFQREKGLTADGLVGPQTWSMTWRAPVT